MVYSKLLISSGSEFDFRQFAQRQERGTEFHPMKLYDFNKSARDDGKHVYLASKDMEAAFGGAPHSEGAFGGAPHSEGAFGAASYWGVDPFLLRYDPVWLTRKEFALRLQSPTGTYYSKCRRIKRG